MKSRHVIIYIRAVDFRPLFIKFSGLYHPVTRFLRRVDCDQVEPHAGYQLYVGDYAEIFTLKRDIRIELGHDTELTDEPRLAKLGYPFA